ncbi:MAG: beta strand repeat-containing protein, partial [Brevundimonas sp.]
MTGAGSALINDENLTIGLEGHGELTIADGALVEADYVDIGVFTGSSGVLRLDSGGVLATSQVSKLDGDASVVFDGGVLRTTANQSFLLQGFASEDVTLAAGGGTIDTQSYNVHTDLGFQGVGGLTKTGAGRLTFWGANTYFGTTLIAQGRIQAGAAIVFSAASTHEVATGATLSLGNSAQTIGGLAGAGSVLLGSAVLTAGANDASTTFGGVISGSGSLVKTGAGTLILTGANTWTGETTVRDGTLTFDGGSVSLAAAMMTGRNVGDDGALIMRNGGAVSNTQGFVGYSPGSTGEVTVMGAGSTWTNSTELYVGLNGGGTLAIADGGAVSSAQGFVGNNAGSTGDVTVMGAGSTWTNSGGLAVGHVGGGTLTIADGGVVSNTVGDVGFSGGASGAVTVTGAGSTWTNAFALSVGHFGEGTLTIADGGAVSSQSAYVGNAVGSSGAVTVTGADSAWTSGFNLFVGASGDGALTIADGGAVSASGVTLAWDVGATGVLNIGAASTDPLDAVGAGTLNAATVTFGDGAGVLNFNHTTDDYDFAAAISGLGAVNLYAGHTILSGASSYTGGTNLYGGTLTLGHDNALGASTLTTFGSVVDYADGVTVGNAIVIDSGTTQFQVLAGSATQAGVISESNGPRPFEKIGAGELVLTAANTWTGETRITEGTLRLGIANAIASASALTVSADGTFDLDGFSIAVGSLAGAGRVTLGAGQLNVGSDNSTTVFSGSLTATDGSGAALFKEGTGVLTVGGVVTLATSGAATNVVKVNAGTLVVSGAGDVATDILQNFATLDNAGSVTAFSVLQNFGTTTNSGALSGLTQNFSTFDNHGTMGQLQALAGVATNHSTGTIDGGVQNFADFVTAGVINGDISNFSTALIENQVNGGIANEASGATVTLTGAVTGITSYYGNDGTLLDLAGFSTAISRIDGTGAIELGSAVLTVGGAGMNDSFSGVISGGGGLTKTGSAVLALSGANTWTGQTTVADGLLRVDGSLTNQGGLTVESGGALGGTGAIGGLTTLQNGGTLVGAAGSVLTMNALTLGDGAILDVTLGAPSADALFAVTGDLTLDGVLDITDGGGFGAGVYGLMTYGGALTDNGLEMGDLPIGYSAGRFAVQTSVAGQVNLVNAGMAYLLFWDGGDPANANDDAIAGGDGVWTLTGATWTDVDGAANGPMNPTPGLAVFMGTAGTVTLDDSAGVLSVTGLQFAADGYVLTGDALTLVEEMVGGGVAIRVGDGTAAGADMTAVIGSDLTGSALLRKTDLGVLVLTGNAAHTGGTEIAQGELRIGDGGTSGSLAGDVANEGLLIFDRADDVSFGGVISGTGAVVQAGGGVLNLTAANTYTGATRVESGTLDVSSADDRLGSLTALSVAEGATFELGATVQNVGSFAGDGVISGAGGTLSAGLNHHATIFSGGMLVSAVNLSGTGTLTLSGEHAVDTLRISNTVRIGAGGWSDLTGTDGPVVQMSGGLLDLDGKALLIETLEDLTQPGALDLGDGGVLTLSDGRTQFDGAITGSGALIKDGADDFTLAGEVSYDGDLTIANGGVVLASTAALTGDLALAVASGARFDLNDTAQRLVGLSGSGRVDLGAGALELALGDAVFGGDFAGTGDLTLSSGALSLGGDSSVFGGSLTISDGATLTGSGAVGGLTTIADGGVLSGVQGQTLGLGALVLSQGSTVSAALGAAGDTALFDVTGDLTLDGELEVTDVGGFGAGVYRLFDYGGTLTDLGLDIGATPDGVSAEDLFVQTSVSNQVNLVSPFEVDLRFWDGAAGQNDGVLQGGAGTWSLSGRGWTGADGAV